MIYSGHQSLILIQPNEGDDSKEEKEVPRAINFKCIIDPFKSGKIEQIRISNNFQNGKMNKKDLDKDICSFILRICKFMDVSLISKKIERMVSEVDL